MKQRVSDERLAEDLDNHFHENEWDRKTAEDLRDARVYIANLESAIQQVVDLGNTLTDADDFRLAFWSSEKVIHEALEAVKHD